MSKRFRLQRPPSIQKILPFVVESISQLSTLRTNPTKENSPRNYRTEKQVIEQQQMLVPSTQLSQKIENSFVYFTSKLLNKQKYMNRPVSLFSIWGSNHKHLDIIMQQTQKAFDGWLQNNHLPYFHNASGQFTDNFISTEYLQTIKQSSQISHKLLLQYGINDTIFIAIKEEDQETQNIILRFCEEVANCFFIPQEVQSIKPNLVLCRIKSHQWTDLEAETHWRLFETRLNSWRHFRTIEVINASEREFQDIKGGKGSVFYEDEIKEISLQEDQKQQQIFTNTKILSCCAHIRQLIRRHGRPEGILGQVLTGSVVASYISKCLEHLQNKTYINILNIFKEIAEQQRESFELRYSYQFNALLDRLVSYDKQNSLRKINLYNIIKDCKRRIAVQFNNFGINGRSLIARAIQNKELELIEMQIQYQRQQINHSTFQTMTETHLRQRPFSSLRCKKMLQKLKQAYISDGESEDLKDFLAYLISQFGNELIIGDKLNGYTLMDTRIDVFIIEINNSIEDFQKKILKLHNNQHMRRLQYNRKQRIAEKIKGRRGKKKDNVLQTLLKQKMSHQQQQIAEYRKLNEDLDVLGSLKHQIRVKQNQHNKRLAQIQLMNLELQKIREQQFQEQLRQRERQLVRQKEREELEHQEKKRNHLRPRKKTIQIDGIQRVVELESDECSRSELNQKSKKEQDKTKINKKKKGFWACFGC